ncbi:hypothetical protein BKA80DRAFT_113493 [Phyllosticta citrichinensis]
MLDLMVVAMGAPGSCRPAADQTRPDQTRQLWPAWFVAYSRHPSIAPLPRSTSDLGNTPRSDRSSTVKLNAKQCAQPGFKSPSSQDVPLQPDLSVFSPLPAHHASSSLQRTPYKAATNAPVVTHTTLFALFQFSPPTRQPPPPPQTASMA